MKDKQETSAYPHLLYFGPRKRADIKMGIAFKSLEVSDKSEFEHIAQIINEKLNLRGLWFFQLKLNSKNELKLLEISSRISTTMGVSTSQRNKFTFAHSF